MSATIIKFTASTDVTSTYNIYDSGTTGIISTNPVMTVAAGTGFIFATLPNLDNALFTGTRWVFARSLLTGIESGNSTALGIDYVNGVVQPLGPNPPVVKSIETTGRTLSVKFTLDLQDTPVVPTICQLFVSTTPTIDYTSELSHLTFGVLTTRFLIGTVTGTVSGDDDYWYAIRTITAAAGLQSLNVDVYGPIRLSLVPPPDPGYSIRGA